MRQYAVSSYYIIGSTRVFFFMKGCLQRSCFFFFNDPAPTEIYTLSLPDALPISDELRALVAKEPDLRDGAEADFLALAMDDMLHHGGAVRIARLLPLDLSADAEPLEQLFEIEAGRGLVVDDRFGVEQSALERIGRRYVGLCGAAAHNDPDPDPSDRSASGSVKLAGLRQFLDERRRCDHHIGGLAAAY